MDWRWITKSAVLSAHAEQLDRFGGGRGIRDEGMLESALARPENLAHYGEPDVFELAAAYASGISSNHPFVDGNKRVSFLTAYMFLRKNGQFLDASRVDAASTFLALAAGEMSESELAVWFRENCQPLDAS